MDIDDLMDKVGVGCFVVVAILSVGLSLSLTGALVYLIIQIANGNVF